MAIGLAGGCNYASTLAPLSLNTPLNEPPVWAACCMHCWPQVDNPSRLLYPGLPHDEYGRLIGRVPGASMDSMLESLSASDSEEDGERGSSSSGGAHTVVRPRGSRELLEHLAKSAGSGL